MGSVTIILPIILPIVISIVDEKIFPLFPDIFRFSFLLSNLNITLLFKALAFLRNNCFSLLIDQLIPCSHRSHFPICLLPPPTAQWQQLLLQFRYFAIGPNIFKKYLEFCPALLCNFFQKRIYLASIGFYSDIFLLYIHVFTLIINCPIFHIIL